MDPLSALCIIEPEMAVASGMADKLKDLGSPHPQALLALAKQRQDWVWTKAFPNEALAYAPEEVLKGVSLDFERLRFALQNYSLGKTQLLEAVVRLESHELQKLIQEKSLIETLVRKNPFDLPDTLSSPNFGAHFDDEVIDVYDHSQNSQEEKPFVPLQPMHPNYAPLLALHPNARLKHLTEAYSIDFNNIEELVYTLPNPVLLAFAMLIDDTEEAVYLYQANSEDYVNTVGLGLAYNKNLDVREATHHLWPAEAAFNPQIEASEFFGLPLTLEQKIDALKHNPDLHLDVLNQLPEPVLLAGSRYYWDALDKIRVAERAAKEHELGLRHHLQQHNPIERQFFYSSLLNNCNDLVIGRVLIENSYARHCDTTAWQQRLGITPNYEALDHKMLGCLAAGENQKIVELYQECLLVETRHKVLAHLGLTSPWIEKALERWIVPEEYIPF